MSFKDKIKMKSKQKPSIPRLIRTIFIRPEKPMFFSNNINISFVL